MTANTSSDDLMIRWVDGYTDYQKKFSCDVDVRKNIVRNIYSFDTDGISHLPVIIGVLRLSAKTFNTTSTKGYITKRFDPLFNITPSFQVKTNKLNDSMDKYAVVKIVVNVDKIDGQSVITGIIDRYIGDVGDLLAEKEIGMIIATAHWSAKVDKSRNYADIGISDIDLTPQRIDVTKWKHRPFIVSVDPEGSKDIDDAISVQKTSECSELWNENVLDETKLSDTYTIGIHIADPSSYIIEGSALDVEVSKRAETYYGTDTTKHMFPTTLSTDVFSLVSTKQVQVQEKEQSTRRAFSVFLMVTNINGKWTILTNRIVKTLISIDMNTTYENFQNIVSQNNSCSDQNNDQMILLYLICQDIFRSTLDKTCRIDYDSKKMIETLMVLANMTVAQTMIRSMNADMPIILRSQKTSCYDEIPKETSSRLMTKHIQLKSESAILKIYDPNTDNSHSTLGIDMYTHFTSPIRRYSDILVHRILYNLLTSTNTFNLCQLKQCNNRIDQMFKMNHYKKFYRSCKIFEQNVILQHLITECSDILPTYNVVELEGTIVDISFKSNKSKTRLHDIKCCIKICDPCVNQKYPDDIDKHNYHKLYKTYNKINKHIANIIHTVYVTTYDNTIDNDITESMIKSGDIEMFKTIIFNRFQMFSKINYKMCGLETDVKKVIMYL